MELVIRHELIGEKSLITNNSLRDTVVLFHPLAKAPRVSRLVLAVAHRRFDAPSMMTKAR